jgi:molybdopterin/thiamine biosynthesis adenylyltransferase
MSAITDSTFVVVGAGGLGAPLALTLALAGAGRIVLVDDDLVDLSNLPRQILYRTADVGRAKVIAAHEALHRRGVPAARVEAVRARFDEASARGLCHDASVVCDGSDDPATKFLVNDVARVLGVPAVIAGVVRDRGNVFPVRPGGGACYRCLFEDLPEDAGPTCADAGVLGPRCGQVAAWQARVAIALATGHDPDDLTRRVWVFDEGADSDAPRGLELRPRPDCPTCAQASSPSTPSSEKGEAA